LDFKRMLFDMLPIIIIMVISIINEVRESKKDYSSNIRKEIKELKKDQMIQQENTDDPKQIHKKRKKTKNNSIS